MAFAPPELVFAIERRGLYSLARRVRDSPMAFTLNRSQRSLSTFSAGTSCAASTPHGAMKTNLNGQLKIRFISRTLPRITRRSTTPSGVTWKTTCSTSATAPASA